ncbi:MAG: ATP synthase F1 subunit gamma [bacterium]|nr:ATP synthase F1 subunit gamma [bacterium]
MASLKNIKLKIFSYKKTGTVTHAMEAVSAVKMRKAQERALSGRAYAAAGLSVLERLSSTVDLKRHPLMQERSGRTALIVVTSDKGLAGALNSGVIRLVENEISSRRLKKEDIEIIAFGKRGGDYFETREYKTYSFTNTNDSISESDVSAITDGILLKGTITQVFVGYQNFISTFEQHPTFRQIVPIRPEMMRQIVASIRPARGRYAPQSFNDESHNALTYTIEPDPDEVLAVLLPKLFSIAVLHALLEAKASEHSARMVAMKSATDKAEEMAHNLTRTFNKVRQAAITREVSEITSGIEAMR